MVESVMDEIPIKQMNDYAMTKWVNEMQVLNAASMFGVETVRVRPVNVYGPEVVPNATYVIEAVDEACDTTFEGCYSAGLEIQTGRWADIVGAVDPETGLWTDPDGIVAIVSDVIALLG